MKPSTFLSRPLLAVVLVYFISCGEQDKKETTNTNVSDTTTTATANPEPSTIITTPQNMMVAIHRVADFNKWKASYDNHDSLRLANGVQNFVIGRGVKDSNMVFVALKLDDLAKGKAFAKDPALKKAMQKGGVVGAPVINFATITFQDTAIINNDLRSRTTFKVKDWERWQKSFDSAYQMRRDNGLTLRAYGHDVDDNHKVTVVMAVTDTAKAFAYWKSDELKKRRAASGVTSEPERFLYRVAKRY